MNELDDIKGILIEMRDNQQQALAQQASQLELAREQLERAKGQVEESLALQREAVAKQRTIGRIALPAILVCIGLIVYLVVRYL